MQAADDTRRDGQTDTGETNRARGRMHTQGNRDRLRRGAGRLALTLKSGEPYYQCSSTYVRDMILKRMRDQKENTSLDEKDALQTRLPQARSAAAITVAENRETSANLLP